MKSRKIVFSLSFGGGSAAPASPSKNIAEPQTEVKMTHFKEVFLNFFKDLKFKKKVQKSSIGSTCTFECARIATIVSDLNIHKVPIAQIILKPQFDYECVPKLSPYAYLRARAINSSDYTILEGEANVFLDNNFVSKVKKKKIILLIFF
jgi:hypothetical protein